MNVTLQAIPAPIAATDCVFVRGAHIVDWLAALQSLGQALDRIEAYVVPVSIADRRPAGLLVRLPAAVAPERLGAAIPCYRASDRLILPQGAQLFPPLHSPELQQMGHFPVLFMHPAHGLIGWESQERLDWRRHILPGQPRTRTWNHAHPGNAAAPPLQDIRLPAPSPEEVLGDLGKDIDQRPLSELGSDPREKEDSPWQRFIKGLGRGGEAMTNGLRDSLPEGSGPNGPLAEGLSRLADLFGRLGGGGGGDRNTQRQDALDKLMELFEQNMDEALRYAIPMDNPWMGRGRSEGGSSLHARDTNFNLGSLGRGAAGGNSWEIEQARYQRLREQYLKAANQAVARGDYNKAAYIYAHLLHDMAAAANVLEQGRYYREAATIYKDHIKDLLKAAECLERGGLLLDAIDLYLELKKWEKAGDLYKVLGKRDRAHVQYERCVEEALAAGQNTEAARLLDEKMDRRDRALATLLLGWHGTHQAESSLRQYWLLVRKVPGANMAAQVRGLYANHVPSDRAHQFLDVLADVAYGWTDAGGKAAATEVAYAMVARQLAAGDHSRLHLLPRFVEGDSLLSTDISRWRQHRAAPQRAQATPPALNRHIFWMGCAVVQGQYLAHGREGAYFWVARFNMAGQVEYYHWTEQLQPEEVVDLLAWRDMDTAFVYRMGQPEFGAKSLPKNDRFGKPIRLEAPKLPGLRMEQVIALHQDSLGELTAVVNASHITTLRRFTNTGALRSEAHIKFEQDFVLLETMGSVSQLVPFRRGYAFLAHDRLFFLHCKEEGTHSPSCEATLVPIEANCMEMSHGTLRDGRMHLVVATDAGPHWVCVAADGAPTVEKLGKGTFTASQVAALPDNLAVVSRQLDTLPVTTEVLVYSWEKHGIQNVTQLEVEGHIASIVPGPERRSFLLLSTTGATQVVQLEEVWDE